MYLKQKTRLFILLLVLFSFTSHLHASAIADSIRMTMKHLTGQELLQSHSNLCRIAAAQDDFDNEISSIREYINEAHRQGDTEAEGQARTMQMMCYYNYYLPDSLKSALPKNLEFMSKHKLWDHYYNSWNTLVELYIYQDKLQMALLEADKMYTHASKNSINYGIGVSAYCMGGIYQTMQRFAQAKESLVESVQTLSKEEDISLLLSAYNALGETLDGLGHYQELREMSLEWKAVLDNYKREAIEKGYTPSLSGRYLYCTLAATVAEIETQNFDQAAKLLAQAQEYAQGRNQVVRYKLLQVQARYYAATKQYGKAIESNMENMTILASVGDSVSLLTVELQQAELFLAKGDFEESALLYKKIIPRKDQLRNYELTTQLDELRTIYEVDKLTLKNRIANNRLYFVLMFGAVLLFALILYIVYARRLRHKNRVLFNTITKYQQAKDGLFKPSEKLVQEQVGSQEVIYQKLCNLMLEQQLFKDPQIKREELAAKLNTNRTYLTEAIKSYSQGLTFTEYLNRYRLRYAANLLTESMSYSINEVGERAGFNSRSTFNRLFRDFYGMSPSEYKVISKEKMVS